MVKAGKEGALDFCLTIDAMEVLPITELEGETIKLVRHE
ncbi:unknown [Porphyromonas sp. CAG:1061]|nr:unknown [Porphyromonas sp. CAG:1061]